MATRAMNRYRCGWFGESHRHYLAAKGIRTRRFLATKEEIERVGGKNAVAAYDPTTKRVLVEGAPEVLVKHEKVHENIQKKLDAKEYEKLKQDANELAKMLVYSILVERAKKGKKVPVEEVSELYLEVRDIINPEEEFAYAEDDKTKGAESWREDVRKLKEKYPEIYEERQELIERLRKQYYAKKDNAIEWKKAPRGAEYEFYGIDSKGRRVRLYGEEHKEKVAKDKFKRIEKLDAKYGKLLERLKKDVVAKDEEKRENARAAYVIVKTGLRPGSYKDTQGDVQAYGLTTLKQNQVKVDGDRVKFKFVGKKGVKIDKTVRDPLLAKIVKEQKKLGDKEVFPTITDASVRKYVGKFGDVKTKDLRTLYANQVAKKLASQGKSKKEIVAKVAEELQNTPGVAKGAYIEPKVLQ